jgi:hypothetical protein
MLMRYLNLAILASTALSQSAPESASSSDAVARQLGDFAWDIMPEDGFPSIAFDDANEESEVIFKYNFTGNLSARKYLGVTLYQNDCITAPDASLAFVNSTNGDELDVELDIIQETITNSVHYIDLNGTAAIIGFCLRVDYNYVDGDGLTESINFYETNVTINVDLTANFTLTGISADRTSADAEAADADLDYPVEAYFCLEDNAEVFSPPPLEQGSILQVCVRIDSTVETQNILVEDILTFVVSQPDGSATASEVITRGIPDPLTDKTCRESGICNVKTQLLSKFFVDTNPGDLNVAGVAILAFGRASLMPSSAPTGAGGRRLRAPIRGTLTAEQIKAFMASHQKSNDNNVINMNGDESALSVVSVVADSSVQRRLQEPKSEFGLDVGLVGINGLPDPEIEDDTAGDGSSAVVGAVVVLILLACGCGAGFFFLSKRDRKEETKEIVNHHNSNASVGTYPSQASVYSSNSNQHLNHRARDQQID